MFYNTGIATYVWVLSNKKSEERKGKVQLINAVHLHGKMRKNLGEKRKIFGDEDIAKITRTFGQFEVVKPQALDKPTEQKCNRGRKSENTKVDAPKTFSSKIFPIHAFGYRRITIERPLRESYQFSDERLADLRFAAKPLNTPMKWIYETFGESWSDGESCENYGVLAEHEEAIRKHLKTHLSYVKEAKIKELLDSKIWAAQKQTLLKAKQLQQYIGIEQCDDMNSFEDALKIACKTLNIALDAKEKKQIINAVSWKNPDAEKVIKKIHKNTKAKPVYGLFDVERQVVEYKADGELRDNENVALDPLQSVNKLNEAYFKKEVQPHVLDAWIDGSKKDAQDMEIGIVGYEIPFNRHFYEYVPPRNLEEIDNELDSTSAEIMELLQEVHS